MFLAKNASNFAAEAKNTEGVWAMRKRLVFNIENLIIKVAKELGKSLTWLSNRRIELNDARMVVAKIKLISAAKHTVAIILLEHLAHADFEWFISIKGLRNDCAWSNPSCHHALVNIWRAAHNLDVTVFVALDIIGLAAIINLAKMKMSAFDCFAIHNFYGVDFVIFVSLVDDAFNLNEASAN